MKDLRIFSSLELESISQELLNYISRITMADHVAIEFYFPQIFDINPIEENSLESYRNYSTGKHLFLMQDQKIVLPQQDSKGRVDYLIDKLPTKKVFPIFGIVRVNDNSNNVTYRKQSFYLAGHILLFGNGKTPWDLSKENFYSSFSMHLAHHLWNVNKRVENFNIPTVISSRFEDLLQWMFRPDMFPEAFFDHFLSTFEDLLKELNVFLFPANGDSVLKVDTKLISSKKRIVQPKIEARLNSRSLSLHAYRTGVTVVENNVKDNSVYLPFWEEINSSVITPINFGPHRFGVLGFESEKKNAFSDTYVSWIERVAEYFGLYFLRKKIFDDSRLLFPEPIHIIGTSAELIDIEKHISYIAPTSDSMIFTGESGTGKSMYAKVVHLLSPRAKNPFQVVNCASLLDTLFESELFGYARGAFTNAYIEREGILAQCNGGTVFFDELESMAPHIQAKLLTFMDDALVRPLGKNKDQKLDVRLLFATNEHPDELIKSKRLRKDFYYRIKHQIDIPPLRKRHDDLRQAAKFIIERLKDKSLKGHLFLDNKAGIMISSEAFKVLESLPLEGNLRELEKILINSKKSCKGAFISAEDISTKSILATKEKFDRIIPEDKVVKIHEKLIAGDITFWDVRRMYLDRVLNRNELKMLIELGLKKTNGFYKQLARMYGIKDDYRKFMHFIHNNGLRVDFRIFRS